MTTPTGKIVLEFTGYKKGSEGKGMIRDVKSRFNSPKERTFLVEKYDSTDKTNRKIYDNESKDYYTLRNDEYILTYYDPQSKGPKKENRQIIKLNRTKLTLIQNEKDENIGIEIETSAVGLPCGSTIIIYPDKQMLGTTFSITSKNPKNGKATISVDALFDLLQSYAYNTIPMEGRLNELKHYKNIVEQNPSRPNISAPIPKQQGGKRKRQRTMRKSRRHSATTRRHKRHKKHKKHTKGRKRHTKKHKKRKHTK